MELIETAKFTRQIAADAPAFDEFLAAIRRPTKVRPEAGDREHFAYFVLRPRCTNLPPIEPAVSVERFHEALHCARESLRNRRLHSRPRAAAEGLDCRSDSQFGWGRFSSNLRTPLGAADLHIAAGLVRRLKIYNRYLRTSEAFASFRAGL